MTKCTTKKKSNTYWRKKGCEEAKRQRRQETPYCEMCGKTNCKLEGHHLLTVGAFPNMSNQKDNIIVLCVHCHKFGKISFHGTPDLMLERFNEKFPNRYKELRAKALTRKHCNYAKEYQELTSSI